MPSYGAKSLSFVVPAMLLVVAYARLQPLKRNPRNMQRVSVFASPAAVSDAPVMAVDTLVGTLSRAVVRLSLELFFVMSLTVE
jgi:hypothetical protein